MNDLLNPANPLSPFSPLNPNNPASPLYDDGPPHTYREYTSQPQPERKATTAETCVAAFLFVLFLAFVGIMIWDMRRH